MTRKKDKHDKEMVITDDGDLRKYFHMMPNMLDDLGLSAWAYRLYGRLKRLAGESDKEGNEGKVKRSSRKLAQDIGCSVGQIVKVKRELAQHRLLGFTFEGKGGRDGTPDEMVLPDIWARNYETYNRSNSERLKPRANRSPSGRNRSYSEHSRRTKEPRTRETVSSSPSDSHKLGLTAAAARPAPAASQNRPRRSRKAAGSDFKLTPPPTYQPPEKGTAKAATVEDRKLTPQEAAERRENYEAQEQTVARLCYLTESLAQARRLLPKGDIGRIKQTLRIMRENDLDLGRLHEFGLWWARSWYSKDKHDPSIYIAPRPEQIRSYWFQAMQERDAMIAVAVDSEVEKARVQREDEEAKERMRAAMKAHAESRRGSRNG